MPGILRIDPADPRPIWRQIEEAVRNLVASGALPAAEPVPSVRDLARELRVNPATVSKAYQRLTDGGVLSVRRGDGTYVADAPPELPADERARRLGEAATRFASLAATLGATWAEASACLETAWRELAEPRERSGQGRSGRRPGSREQETAGRALAGSRKGGVD